jgi:hypothetical protein
MNIKINSWYGRLGNNIIQLKNVIQIALFYSSKVYSIIFPKHSYFNRTKVIINGTLRQSNRNIINKNNFYFTNK